MMWGYYTIFLVQIYSIIKENIINLRRTLWDMFDEGCGPSWHPANEGSRSAGQTFIRQSEEVGHAVADAPHQAGRTAQDLQRPHHPAWDGQMILLLYFRN